MVTDLPPGRELDALIAEKVMEWRKGTSPGTDQLWCRFGDDDQILEIGASEAEWEPSTDWGAAGEVIEKVRAIYDGHFTVMAFTTNWRAGPGTPSDRHEIPLFTVGKTGPHAICLAALAILSVRA